jgi:hypothetical protein
VSSRQGVLQPQHHLSSGVALRACVGQRWVGDVAAQLLERLAVAGRAAHRSLQGNAGRQDHGRSDIGMAQTCWADLGRRKRQARSIMALTHTKVHGPFETDYKWLMQVYLLASWSPGRMERSTIRSLRDGC